MSSTSKQTNYIESALRDGTILGCLWTVTFAVATIMIKNIDNTYGVAASIASLILCAASPITAYKLAKKHRDSERDGTITFGDAWTHIAIMYLCAIILSAIAQYIFFTFINPDLYNNAAATIQLLAQQSGLDTQTTEIFVSTFREAGKLSAADIATSQVTAHLTRDLVIAAILAMMLQKNSRKNI